MAITPTQFAKTTRQCQFNPKTEEYLSLTRSSGQLARGAATSPVILPRMDPRCTTSLARPIPPMAQNEMNTEMCRHTDHTAVQAPEIQTMYNIPLPVSAVRTKIREEFERHRFANKLSIVDVMLFKSHADYQVRHRRKGSKSSGLGVRGREVLTSTPMAPQETMNFWRQTTHIMSYFKEENFRGDDRLPKSFMSGFLEVSTHNPCTSAESI